MRSGFLAILLVLALAPLSTAARAQTPPPCGSEETAATRALAALLPSVVSNDYAGLSRTLGGMWAPDVRAQDRRQALIDLYRLGARSSALRVVRMCSAGPSVARAQIADDFRLANILIRLDVSTKEPGRVSLLRGFVAEAPFDRAPSVAPTEAARVKALDDYLTSLAGRNAFSGIVVVLRDRHAVYSRAFGYADRNARVPITPTTPFNLASLSKMFTGVAVMQLVEAHALSLDDTAESIIPGTSRDPVFRQITIRQLLSHKSGLGSDRDKLDSAPGSKYVYSNLNFGILGEIVAAKSKMRLEDYMRIRIFGPCGMSNTARYDIAEPSSYLPQAYTFDVLTDQDALEQSAPVEKSNPFAQTISGSGMGGYYASAADLGGYLECIRDGSLLRAETLAEMHRPVSFITPEDPRAYGLGVAVNARTGAWGHSGAIPGAESFVEVFPSGYSVIALANQDGVMLPVTNRLRALFLDLRR